MSQQPKKELEVWIACDKIFQAGESLTYKNIGDKLEEIGFKRGSHSDIKKYLDTWRIQKPKKFETPDNALAKGIRDIQESLKKDADIYIAKMQKQAEDEIFKINDLLNQKENENKHLKKELSIYEKELADYKNKNTALIEKKTIKEQENKELQKENTKLSKETKEYKVAIDNSIETHIKECKSLEESYFKQLSNLTDSHNQTLSEIQKMQIKQVDKLMLDLDKYKTQNINLEKQINLLKNENNEQKKENKNQLQKINDLFEKNKILNNEVKKINIEVERLNLIIYKQNEKIDFYKKEDESKQLIINQNKWLNESLNHLKILLEKNKED